MMNCRFISIQNDYLTKNYHNMCSADISFYPVEVIGVAKKKNISYIWWTYNTKWWSEGKKVVAKLNKFCVWVIGYVDVVNFNSRYEFWKDTIGRAYN